MGEPCNMEWYEQFHVLATIQQPLLHPGKAQHRAKDNDFLIIKKSSESHLPVPNYF